MTYRDMMVDAAELQKALDTMQRRKVWASLQNFDQRFSVQAAARLALSKEQKAFFAQPEALHPITRYLALKACSFLTHTLFIAKAVTDAQHPLPTSLEYVLSARTIDRVVFTLPALQETEMTAAVQMNKRFAALKLSAPALWLQTNACQGTAQCACLAGAIRYASQLTEAVATVLYDLPKAEIYKDFYKEEGVVEADADLCDAVVMPYFQYLAHALAAFQSALLQGEYPRLVAYPFSIPMLAPYMSDPEAEAQLAATLSAHPYEAVNDFFVPYDPILIVFDGMREYCKLASWQDGAFRLLRLQVQTTDFDASCEMQEGSEPESENWDYMCAVVDRIIRLYRDVE